MKMDAYKKIEVFYKNNESALVDGFCFFINRAIVCITFKTIVLYFFVNFNMAFFKRIKLNLIICIQMRRFWQK